MRTAAACLSLTLLLSLSILGADERRVAPGTLEVLLTRADDGKPVADTMVRIGGRFAHTGGDGIVRFEGVPEGSYRLHVARAGFRELDEAIDLSPGARDRIEVLLTPSPNVARTLRLVSEGTGRPVAGAALTLTPVAVPDPSRGILTATTHWDGTCRLFEIPAGTWRLSAAAAGHRAVEVDLPLVPGEEEIPVTLPVMSEARSLRVAVRDAESGAPISAEITVAECWPAGVIAKVRTLADGRIELDDLAVGRINRPDEAGSLEVASDRVTVHASADGYEAAVVPARIGSAGVVEVGLNPVRTLPEVEPNDQAGTAQPIRSGTTVRLTLSRNDDADLFSFRLAHPARVKVVLAPHPTLQTTLEVLRTSGERLHHRDVWQNQENSVVLDLAAGGYLVSVAEWGRDNKSEDPLALSVTAEPATDPNEQNDAPASARRIELDAEVTGLLFPRGDQDYFQFEMPRDGRIRITVPPHALQRSVSVLDQAGERIHHVDVWDRQPIDVDWPLGAGRYLLLVHEWGDDSAHLEPWRLHLQAVLDDGIVDPPVVEGRPLSANRVLPADGRAGSAICPVGDADLYAIPIPSRGRLHVWSTGLTQLSIRLRDSLGRILARCDHWERQVGAISCVFSGPEEAFLEVREWSDDNWSASPFTVWTRFDPADEHDLLMENDDPLRATPLRPGETIRGTLFPVGDADCYRILVDHPGWLHLRYRMPTQCSLRVLDDRGTTVATRDDWEGDRALSLPVLPGAYVVRLSEWGNDSESTRDYTFTATLERAHPAEAVPLDADPVRRLTIGHASPYLIEQVGDRDTFVFDVPGEGPFFLRISSPRQISFVLTDDRTGEVVLKRDEWDGHRSFRIVATGPTRYRLSVGEWGNDACSFDPGWVRVDTLDRPIPGATVTAAVDRHDPTRVTFTLKQIPGYGAVARAAVDADGDGDDDLEVPMEGTAEYRYPREGVYPARATFFGEDGSTSDFVVWVTAEGPRERKGIHLAVGFPAEGQLVAEPVPCRAHAVSFSGARIARLSLSIDGRPFAASVNEPHEFDVPWEDLGSGEHTLGFTAVDTRGETKSLSRHVRVSDYFGLRPADGSVVTGERVRVAWTGPAFGRAVVRYRKKGEEGWQEAVGRNARRRIVDLRGLEPGDSYELEPGGGAEAGPRRTVTRVKGLAFGSEVYAATIERDYDQRVGVSVRNHGEEPLTVRLRAGEPASGRLLVGFVGEGSEGAPFDLGPGEERDFLLGISAQDVIRPDQAFPIFIEAAGGLSDEAEVRLSVKLPEVKLEWEAVDGGDTGLERKLRLKNLGDTVTDLAIRVSEGLYAEPALSHGLFRKGEVLSVVVRPELFEGFRRVEGTVTAHALATAVDEPVAFALPPGEEVYKVRVTPAGLLRAAGGEPTEEDLVMEARALVGAQLNPRHLDWSRPDGRQDVDGDGRPDRHVIRQAIEEIIWYGEDTAGDGVVDHVTADIGDDGQIDYSGVLVGGRWERTPIVDAWLEMGFALPWNRSAYEPHDLDVTVNGKVVGELRNTVPEGNYRFRLPMDALGFDKDGNPLGNEIGIDSRHLRGGHYVVNSDFQVNVRLTDTEVLVAAKSREDAMARALEAEGLSVGVPDFSISSADLVVDAPDGLEKGKTVVLRTWLRNVGAGNADAVAVALLRATPGQRPVELTRRYFEVPGLSDAAPVELSWNVAAGNHLLQVVVDPDRESGDDNPANNIAVTTLSVPGDDAPPTLEILSPAPNAVLGSAMVAIEARASDDSGVAKVEARIGGGLFALLAPRGDRFAGHALVQPGDRTVTVRVTDSGGNAVEQTVSIRVEAAAPEVRLLAPAEGTEIAADSVTVEIEVADGAAGVAARVGGGPWKPVAVAGGRASCTLPISFGPVLVEAMAVGRDGVRATAGANVRCTFQPEAEAEGGGGGGGEAEREGEEPAAPPPGEAPEDVEPEDGDFDLPPGVTPEDLFEEPDRVIPPPRAPVAPGRGRPGAAGGEKGEGARGGAGRRPEGEEGEGEGGGAAGGEGGIEGAGGGAGVAGDGTVPRGPRAVPGAGSAATSGYRARGGGGGRSRGGQIGVRRRIPDWYCTNRPRVNVKFSLPPWLKRLNLPKPGEADYEKKMAEFLGKLKAKGIDTSRFLKFQEALKRRIGRMDQHDGDLPGFLESLGFGADEKPSDPVKLAQWRQSLKDKADAWLLRLLASGDERLIAEGLKERAKQIGAFDEAAQLHAEAVITEIKANQQLTQDVLEALPYAGEAVDLITAWNGETLSGEKVGNWERFFRVACAAGPVAFEEALKRSPTLQRKMADFVDAAGNMGSSAKNAILESAGINVKKFDDIVGGVTDFLTKERHFFGTKADDAMRQADNAYRAGAEGIEEVKTWNRAAEQSQTTIDEVSDLVAKGKKVGDPDVEKAVLAIQRDKLAQNVINHADEGANATADTINKTMKNIYDDVDSKTLQGLRNTPEVDDQIRAFAEAHGVDPADVKIKKWEPTNTKPPSDKVSVPRDRDVTFQLEVEVDGRIRSTDIDYKVSEKVYNDEFYKRCNGKPPANADEAADFAGQMDQAVTSRSNLEAYNLEPENIESLLAGKQPVITRPEDFRDTMIYKSDHWFEKAERARAAGDTAQAGKDMAEGMRQCSKQYKNFVVPRANMYGATVPPSIQKTMEIFKKVDDMQITPGQAEVMLKKLGEISGAAAPLTPEKAVRNVAQYLEGLEKGAGGTFKTLKAAELTAELKKFRSVDDLGETMGMINRAVKDGKITHAKFFALRKAQLTLPSSATSTTRETLRRWAIRQVGQGLLSPDERKYVESQVGPLEE